jgi:hypothetical protein
MEWKYYVEKASQINSRPEHIFTVLKELSQWNQWTKSIIAISFLKNDRFKTGAKIKVLQPKLLPAIWTITEISENKSMVWKKKSTGLKMTANHFIQDFGEGSIVKLQIIYQGFLAMFFYRLTSSLTDTYLTMEIAGLKKKCEEPD